MIIALGSVGPIFAAALHTRKIKLKQRLRFLSEAQDIIPYRLPSLNPIEEHKDFSSTALPFRPACEIQRPARIL